MCVSRADRSSTSLDPGARPIGGRGRSTLWAVIVAGLAVSLCSTDAVGRIAGGEACAGAAHAVALPPGARTVSVVSTQIPRGQTGSVTIRLDAQGTENAAAFSVTFDPLLLTYVDASLGADAAAGTLIVNDLQKNAGKVGVMAALPFGQNFAAGLRSLVTVRFAAAAGTSPATTTVGFGDVPIARQVVDALAGTLTADFVGAPITLTAGAVGKDLDGDGQTDLLWEHTAGWVAAWLMNGTVQRQNLLLYDYPVAVGGWHIVGTGDFNGDRHTDILWQSDSGYVAAWMMNRTTQVFNQLLYDYPVAVDGWHISAAGDLNGDGISDILWQNNEGYVAYWLMGVHPNGYAYQKLNALLDPRPVALGGWLIVGTGDLNGDGMTDLVWQSSDGFVAAWVMNGLAQAYNTLLYNYQVAVDGWTVVGTGDMNADGKMDILWQQRALDPTDTTRGRLGAWLMNGTTHQATVTLTPDRIPDPAWKTVGPK